jgi:hypothetical protein
VYLQRYVLPHFWELFAPGLPPTLISEIVRVFQRQAAGGCPRVLKWQVVVRDFQ